VNALIDRGRLWWVGRSTREQRMLMALGVLAALVLIWLLVFRPVWGWREAAADRRLAAENESMLVQAGVTRLGAASRSGRPPMALADVEQAARQAGEAAGITLEVSADGEGGLGFTAASASTASLFGWLTALKRDHGVEAVALSVVENADATLAAQGSLRAG